MHFFKYLFLIFLSFYSISSHSAESYYLEKEPNFRSASMQSTCSQLAKHLHSTLGGGTVMYSLESAEQTSYLKFDFACTIRRYVYENYSTQYWYGYKETIDEKCHPSGTPATTFFADGGKIPTKTCTKMPSGAFCSFSDHGKKPFIINLPNTSGGKPRPSRTLYSDSATPVSSCFPSFEGQCNENDPYGGCYTPPNDKCTRQANGDIVCPEDVPPPKPEQGCSNGATYCERPPQGCGSNFVSGKLNGQAVCVAKSKPTDSNSHSPSPTTTTSNNADGSQTSISKNSGGDVVGTSSTNPDGSKSTTTVSNPTSNGSSSSTTTTTNPNGSTSTSTSTTTVNTTNNTTTITTVNNNTTTTIVTNNITGKTETTVKKDGEEEEKTEGDSETVKDNDKSTSSILDALSNFKDELLTSLSDIKQAITNKSDDGGSGGDGQSTDLTATNNKLDGIKESSDEGNSLLQDIKDWFTSEPTSPEGEATPTSELIVEGHEKSYVSWGAACPPDTVIPISLMGESSSIVLPWDPLCLLLSKLKWAIIATSYLAGAFIILGMR